MEFLASQFYEPGNPVVFIGSLMYHLTLCSLTKKRIRQLVPRQTVEEFLKFVTVIPSGSNTPLLDEETTVLAQVCMDELIQDLPDMELISNNIMKVVESYTLDDIEDSENPGHFETEDRTLELNRLIEGRGNKHTLFCKASRSVFKHMRRKTNLMQLNSATQGFTNLRTSGVIKQVKYIGIQKEVAYWAVKVLYVNPMTKEKSILISPFMPTQLMARAFVAVCLNKFIVDYDIGVLKDRIKTTLNRVTTNFDRVNLRRTINSANNILKNFRLDRDRLMLVSMDGKTNYTIRSKDESVALAFSYLLTSGQSEKPLAVLLTEYRYEFLRNLGEYNNEVMIKPIVKTDHISDYVVQHMRYLYETRKTRQDNPNINHPVGYGIFSMDGSMQVRDRDSYRLRERLNDVIINLNSQSVKLKETFVIIRWLDNIDTSKIISYMNMCSMSGTLVVGNHHITTRPMSLGSKRMANQVSETTTRGGLAQHVKQALERVKEVEFKYFCVISGGVAGAESSHDDNTYVASRSAVTMNAIRDNCEVVENAGDDSGIELIYCTTDLLLPDPCQHTLINKNGNDVIDYTCGSCVDRKRIKDQLDQLCMGGLYLEKPRYAYAHNSMFSLVFDDINGNLEARYNSKENLTWSKTALVTANMFSHYRNTNGKDFKVVSGNCYHLSKLEENRVIKERIYRLMNDPDETGPFCDEDVPNVALTEIID